MFEYNQPTKLEDLQCLLSKVKVINDIVSFNVTCQLEEKYIVWMDRHQFMIDELEYMIKEDIVRYEMDN